MRPSISKLLVPHIYRVLCNDVGRIILRNNRIWSKYGESIVIWEDAYPCIRRYLYNWHKNDASCEFLWLLESCSRSLSSKFECDIKLILNRIGYLSQANRICVALSRAKKGLYVIGNFEQLKTKSKLWEKIVDDAIKREFLVNRLELICQNANKSLDTAGSFLHQ
jgi:hypothetical protein